MEQNKKYIIRVEVKDRLLTYEGEIVSQDDFFITFIDKFGKEWSYNKNTIVSFEELSK